MSILKTCKFTQEAWTDYLNVKSQDPKMAEKIKKLIQNIMETPFDGLGKPEPLKYSLTGCWSRRINQQHRLVYKVVDDNLQIISCKYHYVK